MYDEDGKRVGRVSIGHDGQFKTTDGWKNAKYFSLIPSHLTAEKDISNKQISPAQSSDMKQFLARLQYDTVTEDSSDDWSFNCPLLRQPCDDVMYMNTEIDDEVSEVFFDELKNYALEWSPEEVNEVVDEFIEQEGVEFVLKAITDKFGDDVVDSVQRTQWIFSPRGSGKDADPHIFTSLATYYAMKDFVPQWALEEIAHAIGLDGHSQIQTYNLIQFERKLADKHPNFEWESDEELYQYVTDKYRTKFTAIECEGIEEDVATKLEENQELYDEMIEDYRSEWVSVLGGKMNDKETTWYNYNQSVEGQRFHAPIISQVWMYTLQQYWEKTFEQTLTDVENGDTDIVSDAIVSQAWDLLEDKDEESPVVETPYDGKYDACVYREWWTADSIPPLSLYCPHCGEKMYEDKGDEHTFDYSMKMDCSECGFEMTPYNTISMPQKIDKDSLSDSPEVIEKSLRAYWNRAIRYGFRLSDRIAVNLRAFEFNKYADALDIDWKLRCPLYRDEIQTLDNEGLTDVEFNHTRYEKDSGESIKQMAEGFTVSRSAHDVIHMNMIQYYFDNYILGNYGEGDAIDVDWLEYQVYWLIELEHYAYTDINSDCEKDDPDFLNHIQTYYDLSYYDIDTLYEMYENVEDHFDTIEDRYDANYDHYCDWYVDRNEKNLNTQEQVDEFMSAKEERNTKYIKQLKESKTQEYVGDEFGLLHPVVAHYQQ